MSYEYPKLDYTLKTPQERTQFVKQLTEKIPKQHLTHTYLEYLSNYILSAANKEERKQKKILTDNRMVTVNKRETSFEGLACKLENGEDGIYAMVSDNKNQLLTPKISITDSDLAEIEPLRRLRETITQLEEAEKKAYGKKKHLLKKFIIEKRQEQYVIKSFFKPPIALQHPAFSIPNTYYNEHIKVTDDNDVISDGPISLFNPLHISALLRNYSFLKQESYGHFNNDMYYIIDDLEKLVDQTLEKNHPMYYDLLVYKIDGLSNAAIHDRLQEEYGQTYSNEYISVLWRNKIPKLLSEKAKENYLLWYYTSIEKGTWKRCGRCQQVKLADNRFFSKNKTSKDGWYSICKECRNKKNVLKKGDTN